MSLSKQYSFFPLEEGASKLSYDMYLKQQNQLWPAHEINLTSDREKFPTLKPRYQQLYMDLLAFFAPGDGLVCKNVVRFMQESENFGESAFFAAQVYIEVVHAEAYGLAITSVIKEQQLQEQVFRAVDKCPAVRAKADYLLTYIESHLPKRERFLAAACTEGIFFVSLFAIIFYFRNKNIMNGFVLLNEQVAKDETLHRNYYCERVRIMSNPGSIETLNQIVREAVEVEIAHLEYILREPVDGIDEDKVSGLTIENLSNYIKSLANEILRLAGLPILYQEELAYHLPWMKDMGMSRKTNFYEDKVVSYRNTVRDDVDHFDPDLVDF